MMRRCYPVRLSVLLVWSTIAIITSLSSFPTISSSSSTLLVVVEAKPSNQRPSSSSTSSPSTLTPLSENDVLEMNPDYVPIVDHGSDSSSDDDYDDDGNDGDSDGQEDVVVVVDDDAPDEKDGDDDVKTTTTKATKAQLAKAMKKTWGKGTSNNVVVFWRKNRAKITIGLALFAFRKEIWKFITEPTDKSSSSSPLKKLTKTVKLLIFIDLIRRWQTDGFGSLDPSSSTNGHLSPATLSWLTGNPLIALGLTVLFSGSGNKDNPAYVPPIDQHYAFERMNEQYVKDGMALQKSIVNKHDGFEWPKSSSSSSSSSRTFYDQTSTIMANNRTVIVVDWTNLDSSITKMEAIRDQVSFLMSEYRSMALNASYDDTKDDEKGPVTRLKPTSVEIVVMLGSPGGEVGAYGLAAAQLVRLRNAPGVTLTVCVDKVAASGGYMLACTASKGQLFAAPFALVGSIGVLGQVYNIHSLLESWDIKPLIFRGGKDKAPVMAIGEITEEGKAKKQEMISSVHSAFQRHVLDCRPMLEKNMDMIGNGDVWLGMDAIDLGLVDQIKTSDEYIGEKMWDGARVLKMVKLIQKESIFGTKTTLTASLLSDDLTVHENTHKSNFDLGMITKSWIERTLGKVLASAPLDHSGTSSVGVAKASI